MTAQPFNKGFNLFRLLADTAVHRAGQADHHLIDLVLANNINNGGYILWLIFTLKNGQWAGQYPCRVAEGQANPLITNIKS